MIEDSQIKIAVDEEEAFWVQLKQETIKRIKSMRREIVINSAIQELAESKIKQKGEEENGE